jgi:lysophospholipase L1-like esterase
MPSREQIRYADTSFQAALDLPNQTLLRFCEEEALTCLDVTPGLRTTARRQPQPLYFAHDLHLNEWGNQVLAEIVAQTLAEIK